MPDDETFEDAVQSQCALMMTEARRVMERGYAIMLTGFNRDADNNERMFGYLHGGFDEYLKQWNATHKHTYLLVTIAKAQPSAVESGFVASFRVPKIKKFQPMIVAFDLVSANSSRRHHTQRDRSKTFIYFDMTDNVEYRCYDKASLQIALNILNMPQHRMILVKPGRR